MSRGRRVRIASGVYQDASGLGVTVKVGRIQKEKRFPLGTDLKTLRLWQKRMRGHLLETAPATAAPLPRRSSFARDVVRYLKQRKGLASYRADRAHLAAWVERLGTTSRATVTPEDVSLALAAWRVNGQRRRHQKQIRPVAPRTLRHRFRVLRELYKALDGKKALTPCDDLPWPSVPKSIPQDVPLTTIRTVAATLASRWPKDHARLLVLATTGRRPVELMRTHPATDLDLRRKVWSLPAAKGSEPTQLHLNADMMAAWKTLIAVHATGTYDTTLYAQHLRKCGWPPAVRPYNVRHALAIDILRRGGDLSDVQVHLGHASIDTTRRFYAGIVTARAKRTSARLQGRFTDASLTGASRRRSHRGRSRPKQAVADSSSPEAQRERKTTK